MTSRSIVLAGLMTFGVLGGCGGQADETDDADATAVTQAEPATQVDSAPPDDTTTDAATGADQAAAEEQEKAAAVETKPEPLPTPSPTPAAATVAASVGGSCDLELAEATLVQCKVCHSFDKGGAQMVGPNLWGVHGRKPASVDGFAYSRKLREMDGVWNDANLDAFLASPQKFAPGTRMAFGGVKDEARRDALICYMRGLK